MVDFSTNLFLETTTGIGNPDAGNPLLISTTLTWQDRGLMEVWQTAPAYPVPLHSHMNSIEFCLQIPLCWHGLGLQRSVMRHASNTTWSLQQYSSFVQSVGSLKLPSMLIVRMQPMKPGIWRPVNPSDAVTPPEDFIVN